MLRGKLNEFNGLNKKNKFIFWVDYDKLPWRLFLRSIKLLVGFILQYELFILWLSRLNIRLNGIIIRAMHWIQQSRHRLLLSLRRSLYKSIFLSVLNELQFNRLSGNQQHKLLRLVSANSFRFRLDHDNICKQLWRRCF